MKSIRTNYDYLEIRDEIGEKVEDLREFAEYEGTEAGEAAYYLCEMWRYAPSYISDEFYRALVDEIEDLHQMVQQNYEVIEEKRTVTTKYYEYRPK